MHPMRHPQKTITAASAASHLPRTLLLVGGLCAALALPGAAAPVSLVQGGRSRAAIHVPPAVMAADRPMPRTAPWEENQAEQYRRRLRESVRDLAGALQRITGAEIPILEREPTDPDKALPILVGEYARNRFGPPEVQADFGQGFRLVVTQDAVGLIGENDESASYAVYELLERIGCLWVMPGDLGEILPETDTVSLETMDFSDAPDTPCRDIWYGGETFERRNRLGGFKISAGHALGRIIPAEELKAHPEWNAMGENGERNVARGFLCWSNPEVAERIAEILIERLDQRYIPTLSLSPSDGMGFCQCAACRALDAGDFDPTAGMISITDRYIVFCNRIVERVAKKYPDVLFGFLAYVHYTRPPVREVPHPNLVPEIAPITYCRAHACTSENCPSRPQIKPIIEGWSKVAKRIAYYNYMYNLAEVTVPYPMIRQMSAELPILYGGEADVFWQPETMANFDSVFPGMWMTLRLAWDHERDPARELDTLYTRFYGPAADAMRRYWNTFDNAWMDVDEHSGCGFGHLRRFTPEVMAEARTAMNEALAAVETPMQYRRVKVFEKSLRQFERFMALRHDLAEGRLAKIDVRAMEWMGTQIGLSREYADDACFSGAGWSSVYSIGAGYFRSFFKRTYDDAGRIADRRSPFQFMPRTPKPLRNWHYRFVDREGGEEADTPVDGVAVGEAAGWQTPEFDDANWPITDSAVETWATLGLLGKYGAMWYRQEVPVEKVPEGKRVYLWLAATDGSAKVYVNGKHVPYRPDNGEEQEAANGYAQPFSFDVTEAILPGEVNQVVIVGIRRFINELGTGGLLGPAYLYRDK